jgi:hypothetical protein
MSGSLFPFSTAKVFTMNGLNPVVRYMVLCDDILRDSSNPRRVHLIGPISAIRSSATPPFPSEHPKLCIFLHLTDCRGNGNIRVDIVHADSDVTIFRSQVWPVQFSGDPLEVYGLVFRLQQIPFPEPGLYWVQFWYNEQ